MGTSNPNKTQHHALLLNKTEKLKANIAKVVCPQMVIPHSKMAFV